MDPIRLISSKAVWRDGKLCPGGSGGNGEKTMAGRILRAHSGAGDGPGLEIRFDAMTSHDITYVGIIQTARASGMERFPLPYVLTCCHNSLCAVGGTINADDHAFGLSAAKKYGGVFVPPHFAVIHQYMRERMAGCGKMILGSDSHTRYGPLGALAIGEGGPELAKQLTGRTYDIPFPEIIAVRLSGSPQKGVGPQDVALAIIGKVFKNGFVKNKVMEFVGSGIAGLSMDFRLGIDVMTTETACLSSVWQTDERTREYLAVHGREGDYAPLSPEDGAGYDGVIEVDLSEIRPMIALPFHPSNAYEIGEFLKNAGDILRAAEREAAENGMPGLSLAAKAVGGGVYADQAVIAGCAGGLYENLCAAADILAGAQPGELPLSVYPASQAVNLALVKNGVTAELISHGAAYKTAFCGPCFGAGDVPESGGLSIRHTTRNFPSREGAKPGEGQSAAVALMDARSIAATAANGGRITPATEIFYTESSRPYFFDPAAYSARVYDGRGRAMPETELKLGPNITDWPKLPPLAENLLLRLACVIRDPVTTTDELIPSGETSSYRSNPLRLAEFTLSRKDPGYVGRAKAIALEDAAEVLREYGLSPENTLLKSAVYANKPGDGSAREQAASCQRVLGGGANIALEYATKRYRSNLINWGMLPLRIENPADAELFGTGDLIYIPKITEILKAGTEKFTALLLKDGQRREIPLILDPLTRAERDIILAGCLINYYAG